MRKVDINEVGYTPGCPVCRSIVKKSVAVGLELLFQTLEGAERDEKKKHILDLAVDATGERILEREREEQDIKPKDNIDRMTKMWLYMW